LVPFAVILTGLGLAAIVAVIPMTALLSVPWTMSGKGDPATTTAPSIAPPTAPPTAPVVPPKVPVDPQSPVVSLLVKVLIGVLLLALLLLLIHLGWRILVALLWSRERRRLSRGNAVQAAVGAWTWTRLRRARFDRPLPANASPDVAVTWARRVGDPDVLAVAEVAARVAFNPLASITRAEADRAWNAARLAGRRPGGATLRERWRWSARRPGSVHVNPQ
jgi:hypothetical protein